RRRLRTPRDRVRARPVRSAQSDYPARGLPPGFYVMWLRLVLVLLRLVLVLVSSAACVRQDRPVLHSAEALLADLPGDVAVLRLLDVEVGEHLRVWLRHGGASQEALDLAFRLQDADDVAPELGLVGAGLADDDLAGRPAPAGLVVCHRANPDRQVAGEAGVGARQGPFEEDPERGV